MQEEQCPLALCSIPALTWEVPGGGLLPFLPLAASLPSHVILVLDPTLSRVILENFSFSFSLLIGKVKGRQ